MKFINKQKVKSLMNVTFWGTRGSIACANPTYAKFGGHTSCVGLQVSDQLLIFDAGSGLYDLGNWIQKSNINIKQAHLFLTHFHFDHVMGLPFFAPLWSSDFHLTIYHASLNFSKHRLESFIKNRLFVEPFFPVPFKKIPSKINFKEYPTQTTFALNQDIEISSQSLCHPGEATGYRVQYHDKTLSYITDTEHTATGLDPRVLSLMNQADLAIYDATFTEAEYQEKKGWGHSTWQQGVRLAQEAKVKQLAFFHHAPTHTDDILNAIEQEAQRLMPCCFMAQQGTTIVL